MSRHSHRLGVALLIVSLVVDICKSDQSLVVDLFVDLDLWVGLDVLVHGAFDAAVNNTVDIQ